MKTGTHFTNCGCGCTCTNAVAAPHRCKKHSLCLRETAGRVSTLHLVGGKCGVAISFAAFDSCRRYFNRLQDKLWRSSFLNQRRLYVKNLAAFGDCKLEEQVLAHSSRT